jgi:hypothetical protein
MTKRKLCALLVVLGGFWFLSANVFASDVPDDPIYFVANNRWMGLFAHNDEYAEFSFPRDNEVKLQDAYHISLRQGLGMIVTFADKKEFGEGANLLGDHARWELNYWRSHADRVDTVTRDDLSGTRQDLRITEMRLHKNSGERMTVYIIGLTSKDGVFVLSISPGDQDTGALVKEIARSFTLVPRRLSPEELAGLAKAAKSGAIPQAAAQ